MDHNVLDVVLNVHWDLLQAIVIGCALYVDMFLTKQKWGYIVLDSLDHWC